MTTTTSTPIVNAKRMNTIDRHKAILAHNTQAGTSNRPSNSRSIKSGCNSMDVEKMSADMLLLAFCDRIQCCSVRRWKRFRLCEYVCVSVLFSCFVLVFISILFSGKQSQTEVKFYGHLLREKKKKRKRPSLFENERKRAKKIYK